jgi:hypothetical protein
MKLEACLLNHQNAVFMLELFHRIEKILAKGR